MSPLRASAYTPYHVASADRHSMAVIAAAAEYWEAQLAESDVWTAYNHALDHDADDTRAGLLSYALTNAQTITEYKRAALHTLVSHYTRFEVWTGVGAGWDVRVEWYPALAMVSVNATR